VHCGYSPIRKLRFQNSGALRWQRLESHKHHYGSRHGQSEQRLRHSSSPRVHPVGALPFRKKKKNVFFPLFFV
jgi:hypothetical protein